MQRRGRFSPTWVQAFDGQTPTEDHALGSREAYKLLHTLATSTNLTTNEKQVLITSIYHELLDNQEARTFFLNANATPLVTHQMAMNGNNGEIQTACSNILAIIADESEAAQAQLTNAEAAEALTDVLHAFTDACVQAAAITALEKQCQHAHNHDHLQTEGVLRELANTWKTVIAIPACVTEMASIFAVVVQSERSANILGEEGVVEDIMVVLQQFPNVCYNVSTVMAATASLATHATGNVQRMQAHQGVETIFRVMTGCQKNTEVLKHSMITLQAIVTNDEKARSTLISETKKMDTLTFIGIHLPSESDVMFHLFDVLITLGRHDMHTERHGVNQIAQSIKRNGAVPMMLKQLRFSLMTENAGVFERVCTLRELLTLSPSFRISTTPELIQCMLSLIEVSAKALAVFENDKSTILQVLDLMGSVLSGHDICKEKFTNMGGVQLIVDVMKKNRKEEAISIQCCRVLDYTAEGQLTTAPTLLKGNEMTGAAILTSMADFSECAALQESACSVLIKVAAISKEQATKLLQAGARNMVQMAQSKHAGNASIESLVNQLLILLTDKDSKNARGGANGPRGTAGQRVRSRSRTVEEPGTVRARARAQKSRSPLRVNKLRRPSRERRLAQAKAVTGDSRILGSRVHARRATRQKMSLEPVFE